MKRLLLATVACMLAACTAAAPRSDPLFEAVRAGMTRDDARRIVGGPDETMRFPMTRTESWDYYYQDSWGFYSLYSIVFGPDGTVVTKVARRLNDGGDHGGN